MSRACSGATRDAYRAKFGMLFQGGALFDSLPVWENVAFGADRRAATMARAQGARHRASRSWRRSGSAREVADLRPAELSGGMQKRVGLARAIAPRPEIIFFDEPTTGLDPIMADVINDLIVSLVKDLGATALSITHDMASARKIARPHRHALQGQDHLAAARATGSTIPAIPMSTSSSTAAPKGRSRPARTERDWEEGPADL